MNRIRILSLLSAVLLAACSGLLSEPAPAGIDYQVDRREYTPRDTIVTILTNTSENDVGYNLCMAELEQRVGAGWTRVQRNPEQVCILPLYTLDPGETASYREPASHVPGPGTYRLRTRIETPVRGPAVYVTTDPFTVQE